MCRVYVTSICLLLVPHIIKYFIYYQTKIRKKKKKRLLPLICFSPAPAASNYLLPPARPHGVVLSLVPV